MLEQADWEDKSFGVQWDSHVVHVRSDLCLIAGSLLWAVTRQVHPTAEPSSEEWHGADTGQLAGLFVSGSPKHRGKRQAEDKKC